MAYQIIRKENKYKGRVFDVAKVYVKLPDDRERVYDLVEHGDSVTIVPVTEDGQLYFVAQHRIGSGDALLELPAGVLDEDEEPRSAANRELREEIGKAPGELIELGGFYLAPGYSDEYMVVFLAKKLLDSPLDPDEDEFLEIIKMPISEVYQKAIAGEIHDGKTLASLLLAQPYLK
jgi:ADP-ribose pyrophosphatase